MIQRLRIKFICINMTIIVLMLGIIFAVLYRSTSKSMEQESLQMMQSVISGPMQAGRPGERFTDVRLPYFSVEIGWQGEIRHTGGTYFDLSDEEALREVLEAALSREETTGTLREYNLRYSRISSPRGQTVVFADMTSERATLRNLVRTCMLIGIAALLGFLGISVLLARWAVRPVAQAWQRQKQFVADASHELKTPLTVIMTNAELLQGEEHTREERQRFSGSILTMSRQMRGLVETLLELARIDNGAMGAQFETVSLSDTVNEAILPFEPVYFERGLTLESRIEPDIRVIGDAAQLSQVVEILLDNAQKYASAGGDARITLRREKHSRCLLTVADRGEPMCQEELRDIFKRFYRADKVRASGSGYGLGLSIAQGIVERHRGRIWAESADGYNSFYVELPCLG